MTDEPLAFKLIDIAYDAAERRISELEAHAKDLRQRIVDMETDYKQMLGASRENETRWERHARELEAQLAEAQRDAERYRLLRSTAERGAYVEIVSYGEEESIDWVVRPHTEGCSVRRGSIDEVVDAAIDAAKERT